MAALVRLDTELIRRRRAELGFSVRAVAEAIGMTGPSYNKLEHGADHGGLELAVVVRLAGLLGVRLDQLIVGDREAGATDDSGPAGTSADAAALGSTLFTTQALTPVGTLCEVHGWDLARLHAAEAALEDALARVGITLVRHNARIGLGRAEGAAEPEVLQGVLRKHLGRDHVSITEARLLHNIERGNAPTQPNNSERIAQGMLVNAGLITFGPSRPTGEAPLALSDDVRFSLLLDEEPTLSAPPRRPRRSPACAPDVPTTAPRGRNERQQS